MFTINQFYSPESIAFQNDGFRTALMGVFAKYRHDNNVKDRTELELELAKTIKFYTNINYDILIGDYSMSTEPPMIDKNNIMFEGYGFEEMALGKRTLQDIRSSVSKSVSGLLDPARARVSGYFSTMAPIRQMLNQGMIFNNVPTDGKGGRMSWTDGELAGVVLHEVGHVWAYLEMLIHLRTTNQILAGITRELAGTTDYSKREVIIREAGQMLDVDIEPVEMATKANGTVYTLFVTSLARKNKSQVGGGYDINSFEALADQFAARHGAGRDMVTGLHKMSEGSIDRRGNVEYFFVELMKVTYGVLGIAAASMGMLASSLVMFTLAASFIMVDSHNEWYDKTGYRFKRIRNQLVEMLKDKDLDKKDAERIREDIDVIDNVTAHYKDHVQFVGLIFDYLIPSGIGKRKDIAFQQSLEEMSSTRLFYLASKLAHA